VASEEKRKEIMRKFNEKQKTDTLWFILIYRRW
jgi:hypothetical protein